MCMNMTQTASQVWFILIILFGVFTNKHMQEVDNDRHYRGTELYAIVGHGGMSTGYMTPERAREEEEQEQEEPEEEEEEEEEEEREV